MGNLLDMTLRDLERVIYYTNYVVIEPGKQEVQDKELLDEDRFLELRAKAKAEGDAAFKADIGAPAYGRCSNGSTSTSWRTSCAKQSRARRASTVRSNSSSA